MPKLLLVANRLPFTRRNDDPTAWVPSAGGLVRSLAGIERHVASCVWLGWDGSTTGDVNATMNVAGELRPLQPHGDAAPGPTLVPVTLDAEAVERSYHGFANQTLWPIMHGMPEKAVFTSAWWDAYQRVNRRFAARILGCSTPDDTIWVHDYHLFLTPQLLRARRPMQPIGFFLHVPFPDPDTFARLPWAAPLLDGLLGADVIGVQTADDAVRLLEAYRLLRGVPHRFTDLLAGDRSIRVFPWPVAVDVDEIKAAAATAAPPSLLSALPLDDPRHKLILSVDRLDYSKGIPQRLEAFAALLETQPAWRGRVSLLVIGVPTREAVPAYQALRRHVEAQVAAINNRFATPGWKPVHYHATQLPFESLLALYRRSDIALVTPLRDGMNLIAKEYVAARENDGVLILSRFAGAAQELTEALAVNPDDPEEMLAALQQALAMPAAEQRRRILALQARLRSHTAADWQQGFLRELAATRARQHPAAAPWSPAQTGAVRRAFAAAARAERLLVFDYDGTLSPIRPHGSQAVPSSRLLELLARLCDHATVAIVSGRDRRSLDEWFGRLPLILVAEHGSCFRVPDADFFATATLPGKPPHGCWQPAWPGADTPAPWLDAVAPLFELATAHTPGAWIERKAQGIAWHYRRAPQALAHRHALQLKAALAPLVGRFGLDLLEGRKLLEVRDRRCNKAAAVKRLFGDRDWSFVLAAGDDVSDEAMFEALPAHTIRIKVGKLATSAPWRMPDPDALLALLERLAASVVE